MTRFKRLSLVFLLLSMLLAACGPNQRRLRMDEVIDIVWRDLEPSTSSQNRSNWDLKQAQRVSGRDVVNQFNMIGLSECPIPMPPENQAIRASSEYWFVRAEPIDSPASDANAGEVANPEPIIRAASFLIDPFTGQVVARKFVCGDQ